MSQERKISLGGGYYLMSDPQCCWIAKKHTTKEGKVKMDRVSGYKANVEDALESLFNRDTRTFHAKSIKALIKEIKSLKSLVKQMNWNLGGEDDE